MEKNDLNCFVIQTLMVVARTSASSTPPTTNTTKFILGELFWGEMMKMDCQWLCYCKVDSGNVGSFMLGARNADQTVLDYFKDSEERYNNTSYKYIISKPFDSHKDRAKFFSYTNSNDMVYQFLFRRFSGAGTIYVRSSQLIVKYFNENIDFADVGDKNILIINFESEAVFATNSSTFVADGQAIPIASADTYFPKAKKIMAKFIISCQAASNITGEFGLVNNDNTTVPIKGSVIKSTPITSFFNKTTDWFELPQNKTYYPAARRPSGSGINTVQIRAAMLLLKFV